MPRQRVPMRALCLIAIASVVGDDAQAHIEDDDPEWAAVALDVQAAIIAAAAAEMREAAR